MLADDRYFSAEQHQKDVAIELYQTVQDLPLICPHGHVDPRLFAEADYTFGSPTALLLIPDHYIFRMLYSQGISMEAMGLSPLDGSPTEEDHRQIWQTFAEHFYLFRGTPTGLWLQDEFATVFDIDVKLNGETAQAIYDQIAEKLALPAFKPRRLYEQFNIEVLCTTDAATDALEYHQQLAASDWTGQIRPTFRPDTVVNIDTPNWPDHIAKLGAVTNMEIGGYSAFIQALEKQRAHFKALGATATDHAALTPAMAELSGATAEQIFQRALQGEASAADAAQFTAHMLMEMARMSVEDGLVMQLHVGSYRNHNPHIFARFGWDMGADIPVTVEFTRNLHPLLSKYGNDSRFNLILFNLDETTYARELAPLAGHYPSIKLGPPWWFYDSVNGIERFFNQVMETAGIYNTAGFNDDTRAFASIPSRHDLWRRLACNWVADLVVRKIVDIEDGQAMAHDLAYGLAKRAYKLD